MSEIWDFFENIDEFVYAADTESYELLYMNKKTMREYGVSSLNELKGKKCHQVLQGNNSPCAICNNSRLREGEFLEWKYYNPLIGKHLLIMDTLKKENGRTVRFELAVDITDAEEYRRSADKYEDLEKLVNNGIRLATQEPNPEKSIDIILEFLGKALCGERAYIFEKSLSGGDNNTYEWTAAGVTPEIDNLQDLPPEVCENWYRSFSENKNIVFDDIEKMRESDPLQYENLKRQGIRSIVVVPLYANNTVIGFYGVDNPPKHDLDYTLNMLQIVGYFISSALKRRDMVSELREMSYTDRLTGLGNRYAMDSYIMNIRGGESLGAVYCDITGLKRTNDTKGHKAGDELICSASDSLKKAFGGYGLFRIGGDELLALCVNIDREALKERLDIFRKTAAAKSVVVAVGEAWAESFTQDIQGLMSEAEKRMYDEKREYYRAANIDRRR